jgi:hypothetical protein
MVKGWSFEEIYWEKLFCIVVKPWFKFHYFWRSFDRLLDFSLLPSRLFSVLIRTWWTVREVTTDSLRGAQFIEFVTCFFELVVRSAWFLGSCCKGFVGQSAGVRRSKVNRRMVRFSWGATWGSGWNFGWSAPSSRTVRPTLADSPPLARSFGYVSWFFDMCFR